MQRKWRLLAIIVCWLLFVMGQNVLAGHINYDPYADSLHSSAGAGLGNPERAVGGPDGSTATLVGVGSVITLDMGSGEGGTNALRGHFGALLAQAPARVQLLDNNLSVVTSEDVILQASVGSFVKDFDYSFSEHGKSYRYVRVSSLAQAGFSIDAVEATGYIGSSSTVDTDGGGVPDREENENGKNPEDASDDSPVTPSPSPGTSPSPSPSGGITPQPSPSPSASPQSSPDPQPSQNPSTSPDPAGGGGQGVTPTPSPAGGTGAASSSSPAAGGTSTGGSGDNGIPQGLVNSLNSIGQESDRSALGRLFVPDAVAVGGAAGVLPPALAALLLTIGSYLAPLRRILGPTQSAAVAMGSALLYVLGLVVTRESKQQAIGRVVENNTNLPLKGVDLEIVDSDGRVRQRIKTTDDGMFDADLPDGQFTIRSANTNFELVPDSKRVVTFVSERLFDGKPFDFGLRDQFTPIVIPVRLIDRRRSVHRHLGWHDFVERIRVFEFRWNGPILFVGSMSSAIAVIQNPDPGLVVLGIVYALLIIFELIFGRRLRRAVGEIQLPFVRSTSRRSLVQVTNTVTKEKLLLKHSTASGLFTFVLPPDRYTLSVINLTSGSRQEQDIELRPGVVRALETVITF